MVKNSTAFDVSLLSLLARLRLAALATLVGVGASRPASAGPVALIPAPARVTAETGAFTLTHSTTIVSEAADVAHYLQSHLADRGWSLAVNPRPAKSSDAIVLELAASAVPAEVRNSEAYTLRVSPTEIHVRAGTADGLFAGAVSVLQLVANASRPSGDSVRIPAVTIEDAPRYAWRGFMLDESRHFFGKPVVKEILDTMAYLKLNRFHWHLTDETGWRIEIRQYPRLTTVGAIGDASDPKAPPHFYTQDDIREIVAYARERHIEIVPEIDFPGHATAATRAYPELSGGGAGKWQGFTFNPASERTYAFMTDVLTEVAALFPGRTIDIGGDEVSFGNQDWSTNPEIVAFTRAKGLRNSVELEAYAVRRVAAIVRGLGKTPIGWDEIVRDGVPADAAVALWWHHDKPEVLRQAVAAGYPVVLCPRLPCYFDFVQSAAHQVGRRWNGAFVDLPSVYRFPDEEAGKPLPAASDPAVRGVEACLWTERVQNRARLYFMLNPRLAALAEAAWTPADAKDYTDFARRLPTLLRELDRRQIPYFDPFSPTRTPEPAGPSDGRTVDRLNGRSAASQMYESGRPDVDDMRPTGGARCANLSAVCKQTHLS